MTCIMCDAIPHGLKCTLHGGHMTATEVRFRRALALVEGRWTPKDEMSDLRIDKMMELVKSDNENLINPPRLVADADDPGEPLVRK